tara:strand:- start:825 stop:1280 length:456 start_codon:yes stop_codon:yes gene_type:complete
MALSSNRSSREFDKFVADGSGNTSLRVTSTTSETTSASSTSQTVEDTSASASVVLTATDVEGKSRIGIQIFNTGSSNANQNATFKVFGTLKASPGTVGGSNWTQIGDDISVTYNSNAYKAISTTPIKSIGITGQTGHSTQTSTCDVFIMAD